MVSIPMNGMSPLKDTLFPTAISKAFKYDETYKETDSLFPGNGYWLKFDVAQSVPFTGSYFINDTVDVQPDWNMIGALSTPVHVSHVVFQSTAIMSRFFGYNGGYYIADSLFPGKGYWVKVSEAGKLVITSGSQSSSLVRAASIAKVFEGSNELQFEDNQGSKQSIFFTRDIENVELKTLGDAPPLPPVGCFDVRYESQRIVEVCSPNEKQHDFTIKITDAAYPFKVRWNIVKDKEHQFFLTDVPNGKRFRHTLHSEKGEIIFSNKNVNEIVLRIAQLPKEFVLYQNYPNPFNPTTTLSFDLPNDAIVTLKIYNLLGQEVAMILDRQEYTAGSYEEPFDASKLASGVYLYRIVAEQMGDASSINHAFTQVKKMVLIR
jgi:hypothetical protein